MPVTWKAPDNVYELLNNVKVHHLPRLDMARFAIAFSESKPFVKDRLNWGSVSKFSVFNKLFQQPEKYDFSITICSDLWHSIFNPIQKEAYLDLCLHRCDVEYVPETIIEGKKKKVVKDEWGRVKYTSDLKLDDDGNPKWQVAPLDLIVFSRNVAAYGLWCPFLAQWGKALQTEEI